ncbi:MAG TPA: OmpA family protein [Thermoanaerobaculia bacterium]|nr:OmpA family protein [Thermoanaerobaculia bacterium]
MRRMRIGLLVALAAGLALSPALLAQVAPTLTGDTGLIEAVNGETVPQGRFSFSLFATLSQRAAGPALTYPPYPEDPLRYNVGKLGLSAAYGLMPGWEVSIAAGALRTSAGTREWAGNINGRDVFGGFTVNEQDKIRLGSKLVLNPRDPVRAALFAGVWIPTGGGVDKPDSFSTGRADYDIGASFNYEWATVQVSYLLASDYGTPNANPVVPGIGTDVPNQWIWRIGGSWPLIPDTLRLLAEVNRVFYDGGQSKPETFSEVLTGARLAIGKDSGLTATGAVRVNIDRWVRFGSSPANIGGVVQLAWMPQPPAVQRPTVTVAPREAESPATAPPPPPPAVAAPAPAPTEVAEAAPAPRTTTTTTDEILFDPAKSRLTNIAKAILDGVALRLKNNLTATCAITATADPKEKGDKAALAKARAEAAKDYLVKRHGIDAGRITTEAKGEGDAADATRNRRAVVTVTFP